MNPSENMKTPSFNEIVFETRNKNYGAFELRRDYEKHLFYAFMLTSGLLLATVTWIFIQLKSKPIPMELLSLPTIPIDTRVIEIVIPDKKVETATALPKDESKSNFNRDAFEPKPVENHVTAVAAADSMPNSNGTGNEVSDGNGTGSTGSEGTGTNLFSDASGSGTDANEVRDFAEVEPEFPGGIEKMYGFLGKHLKYPSFMKLNRIEGTVFVSFVVNKSGKIGDIQVLKSPHPDFDSEVIRVLSKMPDWNPGKQAGNAVNVRYKMPVKFTLK